MATGDSPNDDESNFTSLKFTWLKAKFGQLSANATEAELMCAARASIISGALSDDKPFCCRHGWMPYIAAVLGALSDAIFGIGYSPTVCLSTSEHVEYLSGYREVAHCPDIPTHDLTTCQGRVYMDAIS
ncbi:hypothetical protein Gotur_020543 [Gossypium turneri]